jgi:hypothetical protein
MDSHPFDHLAKHLATVDTRRGLLPRLGALPLAALLAARLGTESEAGRRRRRKARHRHDPGKDKAKRKGKGKGKGKGPCATVGQTPNKGTRKGCCAGLSKDASERCGEVAVTSPLPPCQPESRAQTCAGRCGSVPNTCGTVIDCGSCACDPPCGECFTCEAGPTTPGTCVADATQEGDSCGSPGQVCQADGNCGCDATSCPGCLTCQGDGVCGTPCGGSGCCDNGTCVAGNADTACGTGGGDCTNCTTTGVNQTCGGGTPSQPGVCGCTPTTCAAERKDCGEIPNGCGGPELDCGTCTGGDSCVNNVCGCLPPSEDLQAAIDAAAAGATLTLCPGTWTVSSTISITKNLNLVGAGAGQSILDGGNAVRVLHIASGVTVTLRDLTITKGRASTGGGILNLGTLTLGGVSVTGNTAPGTTPTGGIGGGIFNDSGTVTLAAGSRVTSNSTQLGGGIYNLFGTVTLQADSIVGGTNPGDGNTASFAGGGIFNDLGTLTLQAGSSVTGNTASFGGGGIYNNLGTLTLEPGSSVTGNTPDNCEPDQGTCT